MLFQTAGRNNVDLVSGIRGWEAKIYRGSSTTLQTARSCSKTPGKEKPRTSAQPDVRRQGGQREGVREARCLGWVLHGS